MGARERLHLQVGDELQLQFVAGDTEDRYAVQVIGYLVGQSLLVTAPRNKGKVMLVRDDQRFAVRALQGGTILGFIASVLQSHCLPYPYLHLSYPTDIERIVVRNALRVTVETPTLVCPAGLSDREGAWQQVELIDLSTTGARLETGVVLGKLGDGLRLRLRLGVCDEEEALELSCCMRNITQVGMRRPQQAGAYRYGVEFQNVDRIQKLLLHSYVLEQRINGRGD